MNKILEVNTQDCFALVEPENTFLISIIHDFLVEHDLREKLWLDISDVGGGSMIGNAVERGVVHILPMEVNLYFQFQHLLRTDFEAHWMIHCGLKFVLPSGELVRTGMRTYTTWCCPFYPFSLSTRLTIAAKQSKVVTFFWAKTFGRILSYLKIFSELLPSSVSLKLSVKTFWAKLRICSPQTHINFLCWSERSQQINPDTCMVGFHRSYVWLANLRF